MAARLILYLWFFSLIWSVSCTSKLAKNCLDSPSFEFTSQNGVLMLNDTRFNLKGAAWFGFETNNYVVHGLWTVDYHSIIDFMANFSLNGLRLPFCVEGVITDPMPVSLSTNGINEDLVNLTSMQVMDKIIEYCAVKGIIVMLDMHSLEANGYMNDGLWYSNQYPQNETLTAWNMMVDRYKNQWNVVAADIFNEPFDATWGIGKESTDFNAWCEYVGNDIHSNDASWLIMCEGVGSSPSCTDNCFWGEDLQGVHYAPVILNTPNKVVYSPHVYGPSVAYQPYFVVPDFPNNMASIWTTHWGFIRTLQTAAITVGEWGGQYSGTDAIWMNAFVNYLIEIDAPDTWFWCINPDSGDTGGLLENDWKTPVMPKLDLLQVLQPNPTIITPLNSQRKICVEF